MGKMNSFGKRKEEEGSSRSGQRRKERIGTLGHGWVGLNDVVVVYFCWVKIG
ncbi:unnamed protein product [Linum tenue]|uniref:Uncharacterized protein n=1 Tax=Linum tenue TaxID=586396 RepID=A0AAV0NKZ0_9ROSI|nr:unnamed protein product [Linum tenue]